MILKLFFMYVCLPLHAISASEIYGGHQSGCADGTTEGLQDRRHSDIAACEGAWHGHIETATELCGRGWRLCSWREKPLLKTITWSDATQLPGCYAINAAQDGGRCVQCLPNLEQDDLAGVGRGCAHQSYGQESCISGGQMDVSCCVDSHFHRACQYQAGLSTGVLCCRIPGVPPQILVLPQPFSQVTIGITFVLSCQAIGSPTPTVTWYKDNYRIPSNGSRIVAFDSGYLLLSHVQPNDAGVYECLVENSAGLESATSRVVVSEYPSGCSDGTSDGLHQYETIQACRGSWHGHVKRAKMLCAKGWQVCNPRHVALLKLLTWSDVTQLDGCFAYNAANVINGCERCHRQDMAGVGSRCGTIRRTHRSCLAEGRIDVFRSKINIDTGCNFVAGITTGALCCKREAGIGGQTALPTPPKCRPQCTNGGTCVSHNQCHCRPGYKGAWCQIPICPGGCIPNSSCVKPNVCRCNDGFTGRKCETRHSYCNFPCYHGGRCKAGICQCPAPYYGAFCQHEMSTSRASEEEDFNRTE